MKMSMSKLCMLGLLVISLGACKTSSKSSTPVTLATYTWSLKAFSMNGPEQLKDVDSNVKIYVDFDLDKKTYDIKARCYQLNGALGDVTDNHLMKHPADFQPTCEDRVGRTFYETFMRAHEYELMDKELHLKEGDFIIAKFKGLKKGAIK
jgi:hypothetical protein